MSQAMPNRQHGSCRYELSTLKDSHVRFQPSHRHPSRRHPSRVRASRGRSHRRTILAVATMTILAIQALTIIRRGTIGRCRQIDGVTLAIQTVTSIRSTICSTRHTSLGIHTMSQVVDWGSMEGVGRVCDAGTSQNLNRNLNRNHNRDRNRNLRVRVRVRVSPNYNRNRNRNRNHKRNRNRNRNRNL